MDTESNNKMDTESNNETISPRQVGIVKWFSNKLGYGFITYDNKDNESQDVFVHHTSIKPLKTTYRTLTMGEYVEFSLAELKGNDQKQAINITGPSNGPLLSDSITEFRDTYKKRNTYPENIQKRNTYPENIQKRNTYPENIQYKNNYVSKNSNEQKVPTSSKTLPNVQESKKINFRIINSSKISANGGGWTDVVRKARNLSTSKKEKTEKKTENK